MSTSGSPSRARGQAEALAHPEREALDPPAADVGEADLVEHLVDARDREPGGDAQHPQVVAGPPSGVEAGRLEHRPDVADRVDELLVGLAGDGGGPSVGVTRPSSIRSVVVLPAPLGPRNPVTRPAPRRS